MYCSYCGAALDSSCRVCPRCGAMLPQADALWQTPPWSSISHDTVPPAYGPPTVPPPASAPSAAPASAGDFSPAAVPVRKGRLWPPILLLAIMAVIGTAIYFLSLPASGRDPAAPWLRVEDGILSFDPQLYTGGATLTVPDTVGWQKVTALSDRCFADCDQLTTVILPDTLTQVGAEAFSGCERLRCIFLPEGVTEIGARAFYNCPSLEAVCIPGSVAEIGTEAFYRCPGLKHIFYTGTQTDWAALYNAPIARRTSVYCLDGTFQQS